MNPNMRPMLRGSNFVPRNRPSAEKAMHAGGMIVSRVSQWTVRWAWTPLAWTTAAIGNTMAAADHALDGAREHLGHGDEPHRARRLHPVLDLPGVAELLGQTIATAWMPWNMMEMPTTPGTRMVANADSPDPRRRRCRSPWPMVGKTYRKTKTSRNGCTSVRVTNSTLFFHSTIRSRCSRPTSAWRGPRRRRAGLGDDPVAHRCDAALGGRGGVAGTVVMPSVAEVLPGQVDEHGLEGRFGDREVEHLAARLLGDADDPGQQLRRLP